jgi:hypothetical protein
MHPWNDPLLGYVQSDAQVQYQASNEKFMLIVEIGFLSSPGWPAGFLRCHPTALPSGY